MNKIENPDQAVIAAFMRSATKTHQKIWAMRKSTVEVKNK